MTGALIGQETESGFVRGAAVGAISGAVFSIEVFASSLLLWQSDESRIGCLFYLVLHMNRNDYYGGESTSLHLTQLWKHFRGSEQPPKSLGSSGDYNVDTIPKVVTAEMARRQALFFHLCYKSPDEHPFFPTNLPEPMLPPLLYPQVLHPCASSININSLVWNMYFRDLLPRLVKPGDDGDSGSTAVCDTICLQVIDKVQEETKSRADSRFDMDVFGNLEGRW